MTHSQTVIKRVETALTALKKGGLVIVADSQSREAEGDMIGLADLVSPETVNTMVSRARGLLCVPMSRQNAERLGLHPMVANATDAYGTAFTVSTDAKTTSTGISAFDRAETIKQLANPTKTWDDFYHPGHIFPLIAADRGTLQRQGHTEAAVDLAKLAGASPVAYICEILRKDGKMARRPYLKSFAEGIGVPFLTIADILTYRYIKNFEVVESITTVKLPTRFGDFNLEAFQTDRAQEPTLLISKGRVQPDEPLLLRLHSECLTGDIFGSRRCDCGEQLAKALRLIQLKGHGAVLYLRQEGRGIGLANKLKAYKLQEQGYDTFDANLHLGFEPDQRHYGVAAAILHEKGVQTVDLMTNNPDKIQQLSDLGISVRKRIPIEIAATADDQSYLQTKKNRFHHLLKGVD